MRCGRVWEEVTGIGCLHPARPHTAHPCFPSLAGERLLDEASKAQMRDRVQKATAQAGAHFVAYDAEEGLWTFQVDHFSRYGLDDDDDDGGMDDDMGGDAGDGGVELVRASRGAGGVPSPPSENGEGALALVVAAPAAMAGMQDGRRGVSETAMRAGAGVRGRAGTAWERAPSAVAPASPGSLAALVPFSAPPAPAGSLSGAAAASQALTDAGLAMGRVGRAGWAPGGRLAVAGEGARGSGGARVSLLRVGPGAVEGPDWHASRVRLLVGAFKRSVADAYVQAEAEGGLGGPEGGRGVLLEAACEALAAVW